MKKFVIILVILIAATFFVAPYFTGQYAQTQTMKLVERVNQLEADYGQVDVLNYDRGVRSSVVNYRYTPSPAIAALLSDIKSIDYVCRNTHGLTGIDYSCNLNGESVYSKFVDESLAGRDPLSISGRVSALSGLSQTISLDEIRELKIDGEVINLPATNLTITTNSNLSTFEISGASDAFEMESGVERLSVGELTVSGDLLRVKNRLFTGDFNLELAHLDMRNAAGEKSFKSVMFASNTKQNGDNLDGRVSMKIEQASMTDSTIKTIEDLSTQLDVNGVDIDAMLEYQALANEIQRNAIQSLEQGQQPPNQGLQMARLIPSMERMLKKGLQINAKLQGKLNGQPNRLTLNANLLDKLSIDQLGLFMTQPDVALAKVDIKLATKLDKGIVDSHPVLSGLLSQSPLVQATASDYSLKLNLGKQIELNDKSMNFTELRSLVLSSVPQ